MSRHRDTGHFDRLVTSGTETKLLVEDGTVRHLSRSEAQSAFLYLWVAGFREAIILKLVTLPGVLARLAFLWFGPDTPGADALALIPFDQWAAKIQQKLLQYGQIECLDPILATATLAVGRQIPAEALRETFRQCNERSELASPNNLFVPIFPNMEIDLTPQAMRLLTRATAPLVGLVEFTVRLSPQMVVPLPSNPRSALIVRSELRWRPDGRPGLAKAMSGDGKGPTRSARHQNSPI